MLRSILILVLGAMLTTACSGSSTQQSSAADKAAAPASAPPAAAPQAEASQPGSAAQPSTPASGNAAASPAQSPAPVGAAAATATPTPAPANAPAATPPEPAAPPEPKFREVTVPADTPISVTLTTPIASNTSKPEDQIRGTLAKSIVISGTTVVPKGSEVVGTVFDAKESGRVKGKASIAFGFNRLVVRGETHQIQTAHVVREAASSTKSDVKKGGIGAGVGAVIGGLAGGGSGAAIGAGVGGAGTVLATKGKEVQLPSGTTVTTRLRTPIKVEVPITPPKEQ